VRAGKPRLRRDEILEEATRLFAERGYEGASMADLAERVGLRKASLFHHFASKDMLYAAVLDRILAPIMEAVGRAVQTEGSYAERLDAISETATAVLGSHPFAARLLVREVMDWGPVARDKLGKTILEIMEAAHQLAKAGQNEGIFTTDMDAKHAIVSLVGIHFWPFVVSGAIEKFMGASPYDPAFIETRKEQTREQMRAMVLSKRKK
jgi:AcrR family transcriptional regulator